MRLIILLFIFQVLVKQDLFAAEAGMPQLDSKYWFSQAFWLIIIFMVMYVSVLKFFIPKIKDNLDSRENKINDDLEEAKELNELSEKKIIEYEKHISSAKNEVAKIFLDAKKQLDKTTQQKKNLFEKEMGEKIEKTEKDIIDLKKGSINSIVLISEEITKSVFEDLIGSKPNETEVKSSVSTISKKNMSKYI